VNICILGAAFALVSKATWHDTANAVCSEGKNRTQGDDKVADLSRTINRSR
jgi:hypothetical protein